jgi:hypothetical protein
MQNGMHGAELAHASSPLFAETSCPHRGTSHTAASSSLFVR